MGRGTPGSSARDWHPSGARGLGGAAALRPRERRGMRGHRAWPGGSSSLARCRSRRCARCARAAPTSGCRRRTVRSSATSWTPRSRGADAVVTMLHDRVDDACWSAAGEQLRVVANVAVGYDNVDLDAARRHGVVDHEHARRADGRDRRPRDRAAARGHAAAGRGRAADPLGRAVGVVDRLHARPRPARQDARDRRLRRDRPRDRGARPRVRDGGRLHAAPRRGEIPAASLPKSCSRARTSSRCTAR